MLSAKRVLAPVIDRFSSELLEMHTTRHPSYYFEDGNLVFLVEQTLFKVFRSTFTAHSTIFKHQLCSPPELHHADAAEHEGSGDHNPRYLPGTSAVDFERLLWIIYPPSYGTHKAQTREEWTSVLRLATRWDFADIRALAIRSLQALGISPLDRVLLSKEHDIRGWWALSAYLALCERTEPLSIAEANKLGLETSVKVAHAREKLRGRTAAAGVSRPVPVRAGSESSLTLSVGSTTRPLTGSSARRAGSLEEYGGGQQYRRATHPGSLTDGERAVRKNPSSQSKRPGGNPRAQSSAHHGHSGWAARVVADVFGLEVSRRRKETKDSECTILVEEPESM